MGDSNVDLRQKRLQEREGELHQELRQVPPESLRGQALQHELQALNRELQALHRELEPLNRAAVPVSLHPSNGSARPFWQKQLPRSTVPDTPSGPAPSSVVRVSGRGKRRRIPATPTNFNICGRCQASVHTEADATRVVCERCGWTDSSAFRQEMHDPYENGHEPPTIPHRVAAMQVRRKPNVPTVTATEVSPAPPTSHCRMRATSSYAKPLMQWMANSQATPEKLLLQLADLYRTYHTADPFKVITPLTKAFLNKQLHAPPPLRNSGERISRELRGDAIPVFTQAQIQKHTETCQALGPQAYQKLPANLTLGAMGRDYGFAQARLLSLGKTREPYVQKIRELSRHLQAGQYFMCRV